MHEHTEEVPLIKKCLVAVRPFAYTASLTSVLLGLAISYYAGHPVKWGLFALTLIGVVAFHTAANLLNDCFDFRRGLDALVVPTSGAVVRGWITANQARKAAFVLLAVGVACGLALTMAAGPVVLGLGVIGTIITLGYTRQGLCLKYVGLGDIAIFIAFGALPVFGTYWIQAQEFSFIPLLWSVPLSSFTVAILHANNWRDLSTDPEKDCRTVATMLGERGSARYYAILILGPFLLVSIYAAAALALPVGTLAPVAVLAVMAALPMSYKLTKINRNTNLEVFVMLDGKTAQLQLLFGLLLPVAFAAARVLAI